MNSIPLNGDRRKRIRGNPCGSHVLTGSLDSATGTERGPYSGFDASKSAFPLAVIGAAGSSVVAGPIQTPLKSGWDPEVLEAFWQPGNAAESANIANPNRQERIENLQSSR